MTGLRDAQNYGTNKQESFRVAEGDKSDNSAAKNGEHYPPPAFLPANIWAGDVHDFGYSNSHALYGSAIGRLTKCFAVVS